MSNEILISSFLSVDVVFVVSFDVDDAFVVVDIQARRKIYVHRRRDNI